MMLFMEPLVEQFRVIESVRPVAKEFSKQETPSECLHESTRCCIGKRPKNVITMGSNMQEDASSGARHDDGPRYNECIIVRLVLILNMAIYAALVPLQESREGYNAERNYGRQRQPHRHGGCC